MTTISLCNLQLNTVYFVCISQCYIIIEVELGLGYKLAGD